MKKRIVIKYEALTFQLPTDSPDPDFENMHVTSFGPDQTIEDAMKDILELNDNLEASRPEETYRIDFRNENRRLFQLKDYRVKVLKAS